MEYKIAHGTTYDYSGSISESYTVCYLQPRSDTSQLCTRYELKVTPWAYVHTYGDRYGNDVQHFAILPEHRSLEVLTRSNVVTLLPPVPEPPVAASRAALRTDPQLGDYYDFLHESAYVKFGDRLAAFAAECGEPGERIGSWAHEVSRAINRSFAYDTAATTVRTDVDAALAARAGVCQDYAHVMIAVLRRAGIPARYASGYIFRGDSRILGAEASHAWCEAYLPPYGWIGFDPTNDLIVNDHFVKIAIGRDYGDVSPVRGVYRGARGSEMSVNVAMDSLPSQQ